MTIEEGLKELTDSVNQDITERFRKRFNENQHDPSDIKYETEQTIDLFVKAYPHLTRAFELVAIEELISTWDYLDIPYTERKTGFDQYISVFLLIN